MAVRLSALRTRRASLFRNIIIIIIIKNCKEVYGPKEQFFQ
jgi:hypothetical protein